MIVLLSETGAAVFLPGAPPRHIIPCSPDYAPAPFPEPTAAIERELTTIDGADRDLCAPVRHALVSQLDDNK